MDGSDEMGQGKCETENRIKRKVAYFNLDDEEELLLFEKAVKMKNFSKWVKKHLRNEGVECIKEIIIEQPKIEKKVEKDDIDDMMI